MTLIESIKMTAEQYLQLGEDPPGVRLELVNGEIQVSPSPTTEHAYAVSQLLVILATYAKRHRLGIVMSDTDHVVAAYTVRRPDLYFFPSAKARGLDSGVVRIPPELAIEVVSPTSIKTDRRQKSKEYAAFGIPHYWLVDPQEKTAEAFTLRKGKYVRSASGKNADIVSFSPFEGLKIDLAEIWWPPKV